jgi:hypothetical protein
VSVPEIHGTSDSIVAYAGSRPNGAGSVPAFLAGWRGRDGCSSRTTQRHIAPHTLQIDATPRHHLRRVAELALLRRQAPGRAPRPGEPLGAR